MDRRVLAVLLTQTVLLAGPRPVDARQSCSLTGGAAPPRRAEALRAAGMFNTAAAAMRGDFVVPGRPRPEAPPYPSWGELAFSPVIAMWRSGGGPIGDLARKIRWGETEPLPGWRIHWIANYDGYAFTLSDVRDRCGFSYFSDERRGIAQGVITGPTISVIPAETQ